MAARQNEPLPLRPHHGLCLLHYIGRGYSDAFTQNMSKKAVHLREEPDTEIVLCTQTDSLCDSCPNRCGTHCSSEKPKRYDEAVLRLCGLQAAQTLPWRELRRRCRQLAQSGMESVCGDCQWFTLCREVERT
ncbi:MULTISPECIES: DUF1284 domain-containing protein [Caproicibacterium]|jgi:hypothetical protein|uniref:DUF1284 domain-containing protein n=1 Tax=Caproicibacterium lactatifermentans TaxID=2666138 RepID=A0A859DRD3_9FIRM|nr:DUF1284 domain-containing protein [Caproicibacterium lactatifermentans]ARP51197.1 hypothetical protein B6259_10095 [Ruminococcaceae bacterium CPB6]MDD4807005.1 DUF1284 domain-containing protein [Oscillospiraceae bacterium]QKN24697.1 DUF1284 domain-containing protein [Caproicibacterium lactatifermentans]QKO30196.1 DUF1284 domain-containing protein [Caproicibacterium lactatifermentans]